MTTATVRVGKKKKKKSQIDSLLFNTGLKSRVAVPHTASPKAASGPPAARPTCAGGGQRPRPSRLPANTAGGAMSSCPLPRSGTARGAAAPAPPRPGSARPGPARPALGARHGGAVAGRCREAAAAGENRDGRGVLRGEDFHRAEVHGARLAARRGSHLLPGHDR